ncbi:hypothetical protein GSI_05809 [Ganoderma sinense ZZ0214-1]|uniref:Uncharacterized protein n=1 Tax=Ganoderma sinense ZZ0214-1 TaxID=1077348 RepID=A0A2G8SBJ8_9APHY|nr:hypothetical protein GSI_05809 [Ganoderma sinense ZZ0214-1]
MQSQCTVPRKHVPVPLDERSVARMKAAAAKVPGCGKLRPRSYMGQDGAGWSFQNLFDLHKTWPTLKAEIPHGKDSGLQSLGYTSIDFILFWPGYDPRGFVFNIKLGSAPVPGVRDYADLVLEIARCYDAFFRFYRAENILPNWDIKRNPHFMVENLGLVEIRHAGANVFYADIEYQPNVQVPKPATPPPPKSLPSITQKDVENDPVFRTPDKVSPEAAVLFKAFGERFPYPSEMQCTRVGAVVGYDVTLTKIWFENNGYSNALPCVAPRTRLSRAAASRK